MGRPRKLTTVVWADAHSTTEELNMDEIRGSHRPNVIHTMGYILISDPVGVMIAGEWLPPEGGGDETFRNVTFIPRGMVISEAPVGRKRKVPAKEVRAVIEGLRDPVQETEGGMRDMPEPPEAGTEPSR